MAFNRHAINCKHGGQVLRLVSTISFMHLHAVSYQSDQSQVTHRRLNKHRIIKILSTWRYKFHSFGKVAARPRIQQVRLLCTAAWGRQLH